MDQQTTVYLVRPMGRESATSGRFHCVNDNEVDERTVNSSRSDWKLGCCHCEDTLYRQLHEPTGLHINPIRYRCSVPPHA